MAEKFDDIYEGFFDKHDDFMRELKERCAETKRYEAKPDEITFFAGKLEGNDILLERINGNTIESFQYPIPANETALLTSSETQAIGLFMRFPDNAGGVIVVPLSQMCKLSLGNRAKLTFTGDWTMPINKIALARVYEDMLQRETSKESVQIITVYGKAQAIMTKVYSPIGHDEFFEKIDQRIGERFGNVVSLRRGYISHKWSRATWYIGEYSTGNSKRKVELGISAIDSQTGHSGAVLQPCLFSGRKKNAMLFDDAWYSKHMALTEEGISQAVEVVHNVLDDNAQKLLDTISITLQNPGAYAKNICEELNKLAKKMSGMQIPAKTVKTFISSVEGLSMIRSNLTVWDVIEILWDLPESTGTGENYKDSLMKTVSRVINLDHSKCDAA